MIDWMTRLGYRRVKQPIYIKTIKNTICSECSKPVGVGTTVRLFKPAHPDCLKNSFTELPTRIAYPTDEMAANTKKNNFTVTMSRMPEVGQDNALSIHQNSHKA